VAHTSTLKTGEITPVNREIHWSSAIYRDRLWWKVDQVQSARTRTSWIGAPRWGGCRKIPKSFNKKHATNWCFLLNLHPPNRSSIPSNVWGISWILFTLMHDIQTFFFRQTWPMDAYGLSGGHATSPELQRPSIEASVCQILMQSKCINGMFMLYVFWVLNLYVIPYIVFVFLFIFFSG